MIQVEQVRRLASYYRDLLAAISQTSGKHLVDLWTMRYGLTADLGLLVNEIETIISNDKIVIPIERMSPQMVSEIINKSADAEEGTMDGDNEEFAEIEEEEEASQERKKTSSKLIAIYSKQEQDRYNRETLIGFPIVAGKYGNIKFCAPLFYVSVQVDYDPLESKITLIKEHEIPVFNSTLIAKLAEEGEVELVRQKVLPLLYEEEFSEEVIDKVIKIVAEIVKAFRGLKKDRNRLSSLVYAIKAREREGATVFNAISIVNSARSNAFLQDELAEIAKLKEFKGDTVIQTFLSEIPENIAEETDDPESPVYSRPLLFPFPSNQAQRRVARKAEKAKLMVVQGPPGTGKSLTIANLVCDLVAQGKSVLITSHQNKALEVITNKLPQIDYLAMSLIKGEKDSATKLGNQLATFDIYVANETLENLSEGYKRIENRILELENEIRRLKVRFSELKTIEREKFTSYYKFHQIRQFNGISSQDTIPEGQEEQIAAGIREWINVFKKIRDYIDELHRVFMVPQEEENISEIAQALTRFIELFEDALKIVENCSDRNSLRRIIHDARVNYQESLNLIASIGDWLRNYGQSYLSCVTTLKELGVGEFNIEEGQRFLRTLNLDILLLLRKKAYETEKCVNVLLQADLPPNVLSFIPEIGIMADIETAVNKLKKSGRIRWYIDPTCKSAQKFFAKLGISINYTSKEKTLGQIEKWVENWKTKYDVISNINFLTDAGVPIAKVSTDSSMAELLKQAKSALVFLDFLDIVSKLPKNIAPKVITDRVYLVLKDLRDSESLNKMCSTFYEITNYLRIIIEMGNLSKIITKISALKDSFNVLGKAVTRVEFSEEVETIILRIKNLLNYYPDFSTLLKLEGTVLKTLPNTLKILHQALLKHEEPMWVKEVEKAIEAHRLSGFISRDILENPDDINEVVTKIRELKEEKRNLVVKALQLSRKIALKKASKDNSVRQQVTKLKRLLQRKRKTFSFMQLKEKVDYEKLLSVFPCWIMSIDDVARVFPLKEGLFDYLIVDEASQCNQATALHLAYRAKRMIVVGDQKQMKNPSVRFLKDDLVRMLLSKHRLQDHPKADFFNGRESLLALAEVSANSSEFLNEHFRCEPPIIAWSNKQFYDNKLRVLTPVRLPRFKPCLEVRLVRGADDDPDKKQNYVEAEALVNEVINLISSGKVEGLTIGVMSLFREQANLLYSLLLQKLENNLDWLKKYQIIVSTADGFQGDERDIIFYSFRYGPSSSPGVINAIQNEPERINVAFTRAKRKMICFISRPVEEFPKGLVKDFLTHVLREQSNPSDRFGLIGTDKFDSEFEKEVCFKLRERGLTVYTQVPCSGFSIDMVVIDDEGRCMAVECDGEFHYEEDGGLRPEDYQRQDIIERSGWYVHRIPARRYYKNPEIAIRLLLEELKRQPADTQLRDNVC